MRQWPPFFMSHLCPLPGIPLLPWRHRCACPVAQVYFLVWFPWVGRGRRGGAFFRPAPCRMLTLNRWRLKENSYLCQWLAGIVPEARPVRLVQLNI